MVIRDAITTVTIRHAFSFFMPFNHVYFLPSMVRCNAAASSSAHTGQKAVPVSRILW